MREFSYPEDDKTPLSFLICKMGFLHPRGGEDSGQIFGLSAEAWRAIQEGETGRDKTSWEQDPVLAPWEKPWTYGKGTMGNEASQVGNPEALPRPPGPPDLSPQ